MLNLVKDTNRFAFFPEFLLDEADIWDKISVCSIDGDELVWYMVLAKLKDRKLSRPVAKWLENIKSFYTRDK